MADLFWLSDEQWAVLEKRLVADRGYDANHLRRDLRAARTTPVIPSTLTQAPDPPRCTALPGPLAHRGRVLSLERLPACGHSI
jgi:hypothetical protein